MSRIDTETQRLFELPAEGGSQRSLVRADGCVRSLVLAQTGPADWALLAPLWRGVQADLGVAHSGAIGRPETSKNGKIAPQALA